jgi:hypothetical protein
MKPRKVYPKFIVVDQPAKCCGTRTLLLIAKLRVYKCPCGESSFPMDEVKGRATR